MDGGRGVVWCLWIEIEIERVRFCDAARWVFFSFRKRRQIALLSIYLFLPIDTSRSSHLQVDCCQTSTGRSIDP